MTIRPELWRRVKRRRLALSTLVGLVAVFSQLPVGHAQGAVAPPSTGGVVVTIDASQRGKIIPTDFLGLSFETPVLGSPAFVPTSPDLSRMLLNLGGGVLRIGGDSVDHTQWLPSAVTPARWAAATLTPAGLGNLAALAGTTGWRVILSLNLGHISPPALVDEAHAASSLLGSSLAGLALGNEPDRYTKPVPQPFRSALGSSPLRPHGWGFAQYVAEIGRLRAALRAAGGRPLCTAPTSRSARGSAPTPLASGRAWRCSRSTSTP